MNKTDDEILDNADYYEELLSKKGNYQCVYCGGWALTCSCRDNMFSEQEKLEVRRYLELNEKLAKKRT